MSANVVELFVATAARRGAAAAIVDRSGGADRVTTFARLDDWSARLAALLVREGIAAGDRVLLLHPPTAELYAFLIALLRVGAVATVVEPSASREQLAGALELSEPRALFTSARGIALVLARGALRRVPLRLTSARWMPGAIAIGRARSIALLREVAAVGAEHPALLTFTSGSTGLPKGAIRSHGVLRAQHAALREVAAAEGEFDLVSLPIVVLSNLGSGATSVLPDADLRRPGAIDPVPVLAQLARTRATRITASPALVERLVTAPGAHGALRRVARIATGGGPVFPDLIARAGSVAPAEVLAVYGSTEAEPIAHLSSRALGAADLVAMRGGAGLLVGTPAPEVTLRILPEGTAIAPALEAPPRPGTVGEIVVSGAHVVPGYLHGRGDAETKIHHAGRVWHRTGDAGRLDESGRLWLLGRMSARIVDGHGTLFPFAVECAARLVVAGRGVAVAERRGERVLLVRERLAAGERVALRAALAWARLASVADGCPLPVDRRHQSKVDYPALRRLLDRGALDAAIAAGR